MTLYKYNTLSGYIYMDTCTYMYMYMYMYMYQLQHKHQVIVHTNYCCSCGTYMCEWFK